MNEQKTAIIQKDIPGILEWTKISVLFIGLVVGAYIRIPLWWTPVPITLQTFFVFLSAGLLSPRKTIATIGVYVFLGMAGMPFFTHPSTSGAYLLGVTGGYIVGFMIGGYVISCLVRRAAVRTFKTYFLAMSVGMIIIFFLGALWLKILFNFPGLKLWFLAVYPFIGADLLKVITASYICYKLNRD